MKRFLTLVLALGIAFSSFHATPAKALEFKLWGQWLVGFGYWDHSSFYNDDDVRSNDKFQARQRFRTQIDFIASEQLRGVLMFEIGTIFWGRGETSGRGAGGRLDADGVNVETKRAYLDWVIPETDISVRMGIQGFYLPSATGYQNPVYTGDGAGIQVNYKFNDTFAATLFWMRPFDAYLNDGVDADGKTQSLDDEVDLLGIILPVTLDGLKLTPWFTYASVGGESGYWGYRRGDASDGQGISDNVKGGTFDGTQHAWWLGLGIDLNMFDPLSFRADFIYGRMNGHASDDDMGHFLGYNTKTHTDPVTGRPAVNSNRFNGTGPGSQGWFMDAILEYKLDWGIPGIFGWYASGDSSGDINAGRFGRMPIIGADNGFGATTFGMKKGFQAFGFDAVVSRAAIGTWGIGAQLKDVSFIENLTHTLRFAYYRGTNDSSIIEDYTNGSPRRNALGAGYGGSAGGTNPGMFGEALYLTDKDSVFEINFDHQYKIYDNLTMAVELAWLRFDFDDAWNDAGKSWSGRNPGSAVSKVNGFNGADTKNTWKAEVFFLYSF